MFDLHIPGAARALNTMVIMKKIRASTMAMRRLMLCFAIVDKLTYLKQDNYKLKHIKSREANHVHNLALRPNITIINMS